MDNAELTAAFEDLNRGFDEFKSTYDERLKSRTTAEDVDVVVRDKINKLQDMFDENTKIVEQVNERLAEAQKRVDELETAAARSGSGGDSNEEEIKLREEARTMILTDAYDQGRNIEDFLSSEVDEVDVRAMALYKKNFSSYIRRGHEVFLKRMGRDLETRLLSVDREPGGGYWVSPEMAGRITTVVFETSPIRQFAAIEQISSDAWEIIADENEAGFGWVAEQQPRTETGTPDIGKRIIPAHEMYAEPRATQKLLDDAGFNVEMWLAGKVAERFQRAEATAFVTGNGVTRPRGFATYPAGTAAGQIEQVTSTANDALHGDDVYNLIYSVKSPYLRNARFLAARLTIRDLRLLKDAQGRYLWEPNYQVGQPQMVGGYPIHQADDMAAVSDGNLPIAFGDFKAGYTIVDRMGIRTLRDPYTAKPYIKFYTTRRVGGDVVNYEAIKLLVIA